MSEHWLPIPGFETVYSVSDLGRVRRDRTGRVLKGSAAGIGYRKVILCCSGVTAHRYVHEIVLEVFVSPRPPGQEACHGNGRRDDNRLSNLRWDTRKNNHADKLLHGTASRGERHGRRKLSASDVKAIRAAEGTYREIGEHFGVGPMQVHRIKTKQNWSSLP